VVEPKSGRPVVLIRREPIYVCSNYIRGRKKRNPGTASPRHIYSETQQVTHLRRMAGRQAGTWQNQSRTQKRNPDKTAENLRTQAGSSVPEAQKRRSAGNEQPMQLMADQQQVISQDLWQAGETQAAVKTQIAGGAAVFYRTWQERERTSIERQNAGIVREPERKIQVIYGGCERI